MNMPLTYEDFFKPRASYWGNRLGDAIAGQKLAQLELNDTFAKGLNVTGTIPGDGTAGGDALKQQDLINMVMNAELTMQNHAKFWNWISKVPCYSDIVELTRLDAYGGFRRGGFMNEADADGGIAATDPTLTRRTTPVKWLGGRYQVFRPALAIRSLTLNSDPIIGGSEAVSSQARLQRLILNANEMLWFGNNTENTHEFNGVIKQIQAVHTANKPTRYNCAGNAITPEVLEDIQQYLLSNGGVWTDFWWSPKAIADLSKQLIPAARSQFGTTIKMGNYADEMLIQSLGGDPATAQFHRDLFLDPFTETDAGSADSGAPTAPSTVAITQTTDAVGNAWGTKLAAGTYFYSAKAVGYSGRSVAVAGDTSVTVDGMNKVTVTITNATAAGTTAFFEVYRGTTVANRKYLGRVSSGSTGIGATVAYVDQGETIPGSASAVAVTNMPQANGASDVMFRQLYPTTRIVLPNSLMAENAGWILGGTAQLLRPTFCLVIENIGRYS